MSDNANYAQMELEETEEGRNNNKAEVSDDDDDYVPYSISMPLGDSLIKIWDSRRKNLESDIAITGWLLCVQKEVMQDVKENAKQVHHDKVEKVLCRLCITTPYKLDLQG
jgi:hypothetical protein